MSKILCTFVLKNKIMDLISNFKNIREYGKYKMMDYEIAFCDLINYSIQLPETDIRIVPLSEQIRIDDEESGYHFVISTGRIQFTNHVKFFDYSINESVTDKLKKTIYAKVDEDRKAEISGLFKSRTQLFQDLLYQLKEQQKNKKHAENL